MYLLLLKPPANACEDENSCTNCSMLRLAIRGLRRPRTPSVSSLLHLRWAGTVAETPGSSFLGDGSAEVPVWKGVKRFYESVTVSPANGSVGDAYPALAARAAILAAGSSVAAQGAGSVARTVKQPAWRVLIDGRELRTNGLNTLALPTQALALAIAGEFAAQVCSSCLALLVAISRAPPPTPYLCQPINSSKTGTRRDDCACIAAAV